MARKYELKRRAENVERTRQRIVEAAIELHGTIGPTRTSVSAIAERAGVERQTYYRHFPDQRSLMLACSGLHRERHPYPDADAWREIGDPEARLRTGLAEMYRLFEGDEAMLTNVVRDAQTDPLVGDIFRLRAAPALAELNAALAEVVVPRKGGDRAQAALALALDFSTWKLLVRRLGMSNDDAVEFFAGVLRCLR